MIASKYTFLELNDKQSWGNEHIQELSKHLTYNHLVLDHKTR